jgi:hypothetical protein
MKKGLPEAVEGLTYAQKLAPWERITVFPARFQA